MADRYTFTFATPSEPWRVVILPSEGATIKEALIVAIDGLISLKGVTLEQPTADTVKVALSPNLTARMRPGKWSAVVESGEPWQVVKVYRDIITIGSRGDNTELLHLLRAFTAAMPKITLPMLRRIGDNPPYGSKE